MAELEDIYEDKSRWVTFEGEEGETVGVYARCTECGRYIKKGKLFTNFFGNIKLTGWICKKHGEIEPYFDRW